MYEDVITNLNKIEQNPSTGDSGQQQHISVTATLAKINIDLVEEMSRLKSTILDLGTKNDKLTKITTALTIVGVVLATIQVLTATNLL